MSIIICDDRADFNQAVTWAPQRVDMDKTSLDEMYTVDWLERVEKMEHRAAIQMADTIIKRLKPVTVLDLGCGPASHANCMALAGCQVTAVDGASRAALFIHPVVRFILADLCQPLDLATQFDVVLCLEVAEHLPESAAETLCATLVRHTGRWLVFTAAPPGQYGRGHINPQPMIYWIDRLSSLGLQPCRKMTASWRKVWRRLEVNSYFIDNLMLFAAPEVARSE